MRLVLIFLALLVAVSSQLALAESKDPLSHLDKEFQLRKEAADKISSKRQQFFMIGKITNHGIEIVHYNDLDLTGGALKLIGVPRDDDSGRTAGLYFRYFLSGAEGETEVTIEDFLFTKDQLKRAHTQLLEEETTVTIKSRLFRDKNHSQYIIIGVSFTNRVQTGQMVAFLQTLLHSLGGGTERENVSRHKEKNYLNAIIGYGGRFDIIKYRHVSFYLNAEGELQPSTNFMSESNFSVKGSLVLEVGGWHGNMDNPMLHIKAFAGASVFLDSSVEDSYGVEVLLGLAIYSFYVQAGCIVTRINHGLDQTYEGGASWQTAIMIRVSPALSDPEEPSYIIK